MPPQPIGGQLLEQAIQEGRADAVRDLLQEAAIDVNAPCDPERYDSVSPLVTALRAGHADIVGLVAEQPGFDLARSLPKYEPWTWARTSSLKVLRRYLAIPGSDVNHADGNGKTLLHEVVYDRASPEKLEELLARPGIAIDVKQGDGTTPLYRAALAGNDAAVARLFERGADVNNRNTDNRWTILMCAAMEDHVRIAEQLLRRPETDVNAAGDVQDTSLHIAAERGRTRIVELLLQRPDIQVNARDHIGLTPLAKAAFAGHLDVVLLLLTRPDLEVNFVDRQRRTPFFHAVSAGNVEVVRLLLADPRTNTAVRNRPARQSARDVAASLGFGPIVDLIDGHRHDEDVLSPGDPYVERPIEPSPIPIIRPRRG